MSLGPAGVAQPHEVLMRHSLIMAAAVLAMACGGSKATGTISGTISGDVLAGVQVSLSGAASATTTTDGTGAYKFSGLGNGAFVVTPIRPGYAFVPASRRR
jgi:hypothetical protein